MTNFISGPSLPDITPRCHAMLHLRKTMFFVEGDIGVYGIAVLSFFFKRYLGNFDFNIIQPSGMRFFILLGNGIQ